MGAKAEFAVFYTPVRPTFLEDASQEELAVVDQHFDYLKAALDRGQLILAGRRLDKAIGIGVFEADDEPAAERFVNNDPAVRAGVFKADVGPYRVALLRT